MTTGSTGPIRSLCVTSETREVNGSRTSAQCLSIRRSSRTFFRGIEAQTGPGNFVGDSDLQHRTARLRSVPARAGFLLRLGGHHRLDRVLLRPRRPHRRTRPVPGGLFPDPHRASRRITVGGAALDRSPQPCRGRDTAVAPCRDHQGSSVTPPSLIAGRSVLGAGTSRRRHDRLRTCVRVENTVQPSPAALDSGSSDQEPQCRLGLADGAQPSLASTFATGSTLSA